MKQALAEENIANLNEDTFARFQCVHAQALAEENIAEEYPMAPINEVNYPAEEELMDQAADHYYSRFIIQ